MRGIHLINVVYKTFENMLKKLEEGIRLCEEERTKNHQKIHELRLKNNELEISITNAKSLKTNINKIIK